MKSIKLIIVLAILLSVGVFAYWLNNPSEERYLRRYDLEGLSAEEMVESLDRATIDPNKLIAGISAHTLTLYFEDATFAYAIDEELFYLSLAPYITFTHPCGTHSLTTCQGELANETFFVRITDLDGTVYYEGDYTAYDNGFKGFWLPRHTTVDIEIEYQDLSATQQLTTSDDADTCMTTLELK